MNTLKQINVKTRFNKVQKKLFSAPVSKQFYLETSKLYQRPVCQLECYSIL